MRFVYPALSLLGIQTLSGLGLGMETHSSLQDWDLSKPMNGITFDRVKGITGPTRDVPTMRYSYMKKFKKTSGRASTGNNHHGRRSALASAGFHHRPLASSHRGGTTKRASFNGTGKSYQNITVVGDYSTQYGIQCAWDGVPVWLLFDTGSSDTWAAQSGFSCVDSAGLSHDEVACGFGTPLLDGFGEGSLNGLHFYLKYGSDEVVWGPMGYSDISCGGLMVAKQQVGLANHTYWHGNNVTVGILGLAYPSITSAYYGAIGDERQFNAVSYTPFLTHAIIQGTISPVFSVAIRRNSSDGILAWGGLPPMDLTGSKSASTDLIIANLINQENTAWQYSFYTIIPDGIKWGQTSNDAKYPYIVDTGTTMMYLPPPLAEAVAQAFTPPAAYLYQWGAYFASCDAIPPYFAMTIGGVDFWINPSHMIYQDLVDPMTGYCAIAVASGGSGPYILGDAFLQNVVAVFDVGGAQMRFYSRQD